MCMFWRRVPHKCVGGAASDIHILMLISTTQSKSGRDMLNTVMTYSVMKPLNKNEKKLLKIFLIASLHRLFTYLIDQNIQKQKVQNRIEKTTEFRKECYKMDGKMLQGFIREIVDTGEYTLEGIASCTRIPLDVILDMICGYNLQPSITFWTRIVDLYLQVKPEISQLFFEKLIEVKEKNNLSLSALLNEAV